MLYNTIILSIVVSALGVGGFLVNTPARPRLFFTSALPAKKAGKSSRRKAVSAGGGGGFGSATRSTVKEAPIDDYAILPALEPNVLDTLVPMPEMGQAGELPSEIYQRLDQIYGFPRFNYDENEDEKKPTVSFLDDMLSTSSSSDSSGLDDLLKPKPSSTGNIDLDDFSASATGAGGSVSGGAAEAPSKPDLSLESLPPFSKFRVLHLDPLVLAIDDFFTEDECDRYIDMSNNNKNVMKSRSPTVGRDSVAKAQRTSTTHYHTYKSVPELMAKASRLLGLDSIDRWEEPQTVRYRRNEKFTWHLDALGPTENKEDLGGQRTATLLVYLTDLEEEEGGATMFRDLGGSDGPLRVRPQKGSALLFFPAAGGIPNAPFDIRTLHCGEAVSSSSSHDKWISQLWLREGTYKPTAPPGNEHAEASDAISDYCTSFE